MLSAQKWNKNEILFKSSEKVLWLPWYSDWSLSNSFPKPYSSVCVSIFYSWSLSWVWFKGLYFTNYWWNITSYNHWYNPYRWIGEKSYQIFEYLAFHWRIHNFGTYVFIKGQIKSEWIYEIINFQKMNWKIWKISALRVFIVDRAEILQIFLFTFWKIEDFINNKSCRISTTPNTTKKKNVWFQTYTAI